MALRKCTHNFDKPWHLKSYFVITTCFTHPAKVSPNNFDWNRILGKVIFPGQTNEIEAKLFHTPILEKSGAIFSSPLLPQDFLFKTHYFSFKFDYICHYTGFSTPRRSLKIVRTLHFIEAPLWCHILKFSYSPTSFRYTFLRMIFDKRAFLVIWKNSVSLICII